MVKIIINYLESLVPLPLPLPGVKLGLANCIGLVVLCLYDEKDYILFNILKVFMVALLRTGFGTSFFKDANARQSLYYSFQTRQALQPHAPYWKALSVSFFRELLPRA